MPERIFQSRLLGFDDAGRTRGGDAKAEPTEGRDNPNRGIIYSAARL
jgi:hypothetical protein